MVWGMNHPPVSNGIFYLAGEFEGPARNASDGWRTRLAQHFVEEMPSVEQAVFQDENGAGSHWYACHAVRKFTLRPEFGNTNRAESQKPIRPHEVPRYFRSSGNFEKLASIALFSGPLLTVDETLKSFVEWLEPGVHKFIPIEVRRARDKAPVHNRYIFVVERRFDSFSEVHSDSQSFQISPDRQWVKHAERPALMRRLAFRRAEFGDAHVWLERRLAGYLLCISDSLQSEIADAGLRIPKHFQMKEV